MQPRYLLVWFLLLVLLFGCAGKKAQNLARATLGQVKAYEQEVGNKITAENKYYHNRVASLQRVVKGLEEESLPISVETAAFAFQSEVFNAKNDFQPKALKDAVFKVLEDVRQSRERFAKARIDYEENMLKSLAKLEFQKQSLGKVQQGLGQLQSKANNLKMLKEWFEFAYKMKQEFEKSLPAEASK